MVTLWLGLWTLNGMVWVRALAGVITLCFQARYVTLTMPLSTQVYKWVPANLMLGGSHKMDPNNPSGGGEGGESRNITSRFMLYRNRDKLCMTHVPFGLTLSTYHSLVITSGETHGLMFSLWVSGGKTTKHTDNNCCLSPSNEKLQT